MKAWVSRDVPASIEAALMSAIYSAESVGLTPVSLHLGPEKWREFKWWICCTPIKMNLADPFPLIEDRYEYRGLPVRPGVVHGIVVECE